MHCSVPPARTAYCRMSASACGSRGISAGSHRTVRPCPCSCSSRVTRQAALDQLQLLRRTAEINLSVIRQPRGACNLLVCLQLDQDEHITT